MKQIRCFFHLPILLAIVIPAFGADRPVSVSSPECDEFISTSPCVVTFDMKKATPDANGMIRVPTHSDVQTRVHGDSAIHLANASPFLACTVQATPGAPTRDLSSSVTAALTTLGGLGAISITPKAQGVAENVPETDYVAKLKNAFRTVINDKTTGWLYTFDTPAAAQKAATTIYTALFGLLQDEKDYERNVINGGGNQNDIRDQLDDLRKIRDSIQQYFSVVSGLVKDQTISGQHVITSTVSNDILIPMDRFRQKAVSETITCKDAATQTQTFSTMTFTAFYENTPVFDISAGAIMSTTPGRQVGVVSGPYNATGVANPSSCVAQATPVTCLGVTSQSRIQFMPAAFVEWHGDWKWPGVHNGRAYHPFGYVGTLGPAFGIAVNPNNGTASAEFFEGVSLGIHRVAIMAGFHNGRYQTFADGYYPGEVVPSTVTSPRTERTWTTHFAIAVTYRIPFR